MVEVVGPGFDASDILRGDIQAHETWKLALGPVPPRRGPDLVKRAERIHLTTLGQYEESVQARLAKIGARIKNPAVPRHCLAGSRRGHRTAPRGGNYLLEDHASDCIVKECQGLCSNSTKALDVVCATR